MCINIYYMINKYLFLFILQMRKLRLKLPRSHSLSYKKLEFAPQNYAYDYDT